MFDSLSTGFGIPGSTDFNISDEEMAALERECPGLFSDMTTTSVAPQCHVGPHQNGGMNPSFVAPSMTPGVDYTNCAPYTMASNMVSTYTDGASVYLDPNTGLLMDSLTGAPVVFDEPDVVADSYRTDTPGSFPLTSEPFKPGQSLTELIFNVTGKTSIPSPTGSGSDDSGVDMTSPSSSQSPAPITEGDYLQRPAPGKAPRNKRTGGPKQTERERKDKNNVASKVCRDKKRAKNKGLEEREKELKKANAELRTQLENMQKEADNLRQQLTSRLQMKGQEV